MSQSFLGKPKKGQQYYVILDDGGFNRSVGTGSSERDAADDAEVRWRAAFHKSQRPTRKTVFIDAIPSKTGFPGKAGGS
jgi:hypothetical protein